VEFGAFSGIMRDETQGSDCGTTRAQIFSTNETEFVWRKYAKLRTALFPYIYTSAHQSAQTGMPIMRHHVLSFPNDSLAISQPYQYLFGDSILVAPVVVKGATAQEIYLPLGVSWIDATSSMVYDNDTGRFRIGYSQFSSGGTSIKVSSVLDVCPFFVKAGTIITTIDPSVLTLNNATIKNITTLADRYQMLHLWIWPAENGTAIGEVWDGAVFQLNRITSKLFSFTSNDPYSRTLSLQWISQTSPSLVMDGSGQSLPQASSWQQIAQFNISKSSQSAWFYDNSQEVLWVRMVPGLYQVLVEF